MKSTSSTMQPRHITIPPLTKLSEPRAELFKKQVLMAETGVQVKLKDNIKACYFHEGFTKKYKLCQPRSANSIIKWYANFRFSLASYLSLKPFYLTEGSMTFYSGHWLSWYYWLNFARQGYKNQIFDVFLSKMSMSKSVKIFHYILA